MFPLFYQSNKFYIKCNYSIFILSAFNIPDHFHFSQLTISTKYYHSRKKKLLGKNRYIIIGIIDMIR